MENKVAEVDLDGRVVTFDIQAPDSPEFEFSTEVEPKPLKNFTLQPKTTMRQKPFDVICHFNQPFTGNLEYFMHFQYLFRQEFAESVNCTVKLDLVDADYLELLASEVFYFFTFICDRIKVTLHKSIKRDPICSEIYLSRLTADQLLELFGLCVYLVETKILKIVVAKLLENNDNVKHVLQLFLYFQDFDLPKIAMESIHDFIDFNFDAVISTPEWLDFSQESVKLFLNRRTIRISEQKIATAIRNWMEKNQPKTQDKLDKKIRKAVLKNFAQCLCCPLPCSYMCDFEDEITADFQWLSDELEEVKGFYSDNNQQFNPTDAHNFRRNFKDPEPTYAIITDSDGDRG